MKITTLTTISEYLDKIKGKTIQNITFDRSGTLYGSPEICFYMTDGTQFTLEVAEGQIEIQVNELFTKIK